MEASAHDSASSDGTIDSARGPDAMGSEDAADAGTPDVANGDGAAAETDADAAEADAATVPPPNPALPPDASALTCPTAITGSLDTTDGTQVGRHSRIGNASTCATPKAFPGNAADPSNPHLYDVYRFGNPTSAAVCFTFTLTDGTIAVVDSGSDAAIGDAESDAGDAAADAPVDAAIDATLADASDGATDTDGATDAGADADAATGPTATPKYMTAYTTFYPTSLSTGYAGDVGSQLVSPQTMAITVPAGSTIDVVVYAIAVAPAGVGSYALSCTTP